MLQLSEMQEKKLGRLLIRGFTKKQRMIFESIGKDRSRSITSASKKISEEQKIPLSTVKLDLRIFDQLGLIRIIEKGDFKKVSITKFGKMVLGILSNYSKLNAIFTRLIGNIIGLFSITLLRGEMNDR